MSEQGRISFWAAVLMSINIIVGGGIFAGPQTIATAVGSMGFAVWLLVGLLLFPVVWSIAQAARLYPGAGGFYNYCAQGINPTFGFIAQWAYLLGYMGTAMSMVILLRTNFINRLGFSMVQEHPLLFNAAVILFFSLLNLLSISVISRIQSSVTLLKLLPLIFVISAFGWYWNPSITYSLGDLGNVGAALPAAIFGFWGFEACCSLGHLLKDGPQSVGKVMLVAFFITAALYSFFQLGLTNIMGVAGLSGQAPTAVASFMGLSPFMTSLVAIAIIGSILISYANSFFGVSLSNITNIFGLAEKNMLIGQSMLTKVNAIGRPTFAALVHGLAIFGLLIFITDIDISFSFTCLGVGTAFVLTLIALFISYLKQKNSLQLLITLLAFGSFGFLMYYCWMGMGSDTVARLTNASPLILGTLLGLVMYKIQQCKQLVR
jgi:amino acid transporter